MTSPAFFQNPRQLAVDSVLDRPILISIRKKHRQFHEYNLNFPGKNVVKDHSSCMLEAPEDGLAESTLQRPNPSSFLYGK